MTANAANEDLRGMLMRRSSHRRGLGNITDLPIGINAEARLSLRPATPKMG
jgi:hypothetical protein